MDKKNRMPVEIVTRRQSTTPHPQDEQIIAALKNYHSKYQKEGEITEN